ncbi:MAG: hypothetical protein AAF699_09255 [Pseudomonadota bacterium]
MTKTLIRPPFIAIVLAAIAGCSDSGNNRDGGMVAEPVAPTPPNESTVFEVANSCIAISPDAGENYIAATEVLFGGPNETPSGLGPLLDPTTDLPILTGDIESADRVLLRPSDLGKYLLYTDAGNYLFNLDGAVAAKNALRSDTRLVDGEVIITDRMQSEGEWRLFAAADGRFQLQHLLSEAFLQADGTLGANPADLDFIEQTGCAEFPELTVDAQGEVSVTQFEDGDVFGFVDSHSHIFTNLSFGGGGVFHGAPFHPLGVEHALPNCELAHGVNGRRDLVGAGFGGDTGITADLLPALLSGELTEDNHQTDGYPEFTDWPNAPFSATHQMQYYTWIERAYKAGLRLVVQHATTNQFLCQLAVGVGAQPKRFDCNDMVSADRIIEATYAMERYIDALAGGPKKGWFRIVRSPEEAREEILAGKLAVVLGLEVSDLFDCFLVPFNGFEPCTTDDVIAKLDEYHDRGIRAVFPVHKYDNGFSAGDGDRRVAIGNFGHTGHFSSFIRCPEELLTFSSAFDKGGVPLAGLNMPREVYDAPPPFDMSGIEEDPVGTLLPGFALLDGGELEGEYCQRFGLTTLGEFLVMELMKRGMIIEIDHFPRKSYQRAFELLQAFDYPAMGTHGRNKNGELYQLGGMSTLSLGRCRTPGVPATMDDSFQARIQLIRENGGYPAEGFGFDLNGLSSYPLPRFGERSRCSEPQTDEGITYPFTSYGGDVTLTQPVVGNRILDFNTEGMVHLGLVAEVIEDVRRDGVTDAELEPLFRSAEAYLRVWEKSEARGKQIAPD